MLFKIDDVHDTLDRVKSGIDAATRGEHAPDLIDIAQAFKGAAETVRIFATRPATIAKLNAQGVRATVAPKLNLIDTLASGGNLGAVLLHSREILTVMALPGDPASVPLHLPKLSTVTVALDGDTASVPERHNEDEAALPGEPAWVPDREGEDAPKASPDGDPASVPERGDG